MASLKQSFAHCRQVARARARNFYYAFLLLPREQKDAICAVYAFMRYADDITDEAAPSPAARRAALERWRAALDSALRGQCGSDPILPAFRATIERYGIPERYFHELIEGVGQDIEPARFATFGQLYQYCYRVASVAGLTCVHIFGYDSPRALELAEKCGVAFQLTNILRDIPEDAAMGRVYLPDEDLSQFGLHRQDLIDGCRDERFYALMEFEWRRAQRYYLESAPLLELVRPRSRAALWAMIAIYHGILKRIQRVRYDVYRRRVRLSDLEKSWIVLQALRLRLLGGAPPFPA